MGITTERYDEIMQEAVSALRLDVLDYVYNKYPEEAQAFEEKLNEYAEMDIDTPSVEQE